jgi:murein DD-endopeptidase MepM/ murein hydrolase activator NlpD
MVMVIMPYQKIKKASIFVVMFVVSASILLYVGANVNQDDARAESLSELQNRAATLQAQIDENNQKAAELAKEADGLKKKIGEYDIEISKADTAIQLTTLKIDELTEKLNAAQLELDRQKELLKTTLRALYKKGDASSFELLVGSSSFSQFINEQEYLGRLREGIQSSTEKVIELKQQIKEQQEEQKKLLEEQQAAKSVLDGLRSDRQALLTQTEGQEAAYRAISANQQAELRKAEEALSAILATGTFVSLGPVSQGDIIGRVGSTGYSTGPHLHLEARRPNGTTLNPIQFMGSEWIYPVQPVEITQNFGENNGFFYGAHQGTDFGGTGKPVAAVASGNVIVRGCSQNQSFLGFSPGYGYVVVIQHFNGFFSVYAHMTPPAGGYEECSGSYL